MGLEVRANCHASRAFNCGNCGRTRAGSSVLARRGAAARRRRHDRCGRLCRRSLAQRRAGESPSRPGCGCRRPGDRCAVTQSSGSRSLDDGTCPLMMRRAIFRPALDGAGAGYRRREGHVEHEQTAPGKGRPHPTRIEVHRSAQPSSRDISPATTILPMLCADANKARSGSG